MVDQATGVAERQPDHHEEEHAEAEHRRVDRSARGVLAQLIVRSSAGTTEAEHDRGASFHRPYGSPVTPTMMPPPEAAKRRLIAAGERRRWRADRGQPDHPAAHHDARQNGANRITRTRTPPWRSTPSGPRSATARCGCG